MKKLNKKGFTLIEIIVVVVVLAVLMAVAVPSVLKYVNEADNAKYMAQGRSVMNMAQTEMVKAYVGDNKITSTEVGNILDTIEATSGKEGMGTITTDSVKIYTTPVTITEANGTFTFSGTAFTGSDDASAEIPTLTAVECVIGGKTIVAVPNGKIYVK